MVYLNEILKKNRERLREHKNLELVAYLSIQDYDSLINSIFDLTLEEEIALAGYKKEPIESSKVIAITSKAPIKGISAVSNVYKFSGLYLSAKSELSSKMNEKYQQSNLKQKYFLVKIEPSFTATLTKEVADVTNDPIAILVKEALESKNPDISLIHQSLQKIISTADLDVQLQILLEDIESLLLTTTFDNKSAVDISRDILLNFSNAIQKIITGRRLNHANFEINDEYDVQDLVYVIFKSVFPNMREEDPIPKVGGKSTKIDLILREEKILIEVKMIKAKDNNETHFIEQLKVDFESYHQCQWLEKLFCFVYDPYKKTRDISNFKDLNGQRSKGGHVFDVEVIVAN